jgi:hypothetical protein
VRSLLLNEPFVQQYRTPESCRFDALLVSMRSNEYVPSQQEIIAVVQPQLQSRLDVKHGACQQPATWPHNMEERAR